MGKSVYDYLKRWKLLH